MKIEPSLGLGFWLAALVLLLTSMMFNSVVFAMSPRTIAPFQASCKTHSMNMPCQKFLYGYFLNDTDKTNMSWGDIILYDPRCTENHNSWLCKGLQISYGSRSRVIHRIVGWNGTCYTTQGDNNEMIDDICVKPAMVMFKLEESK
jgi:hypothetical protein